MGTVMGEKIVVSLREISEHFAIGIEGARAKAKRRAAKGVWRILPQNHPADPLRVELPADEWEKGTQREASTSPNEEPQTPTPSQETQRGDTHDIRALVELLEKLTEQSTATTDKLVTAEREKGEAELRAAVAVAGRDAAESSLASVRQELQEIRDRMSGEVRQAKADLDAWKARPWWKRLAG